MEKKNPQSSHGPPTSQDIDKENMVKAYKGMLGCLLRGCGILSLTTARWANYGVIVLEEIRQSIARGEILYGYIDK